VTAAEPERSEREGALHAPVADRRNLLLLALATALFLVIAGYPRQWSMGLLINDEFWYAHLTRSLYHGDGYVSYAMYPLQAAQVDTFPVPEAMKQPGYQLLAAAIWLFTGESIRAMLFLSLAGLVGFAAAVYLLARHLGWGSALSLFVAATTVAPPVIAQYGVQALPESLYFACFILTVLLVLRGRLPDLAAAGALNAILMLIKGHGLIYIPVFAAFVWLRGASSFGAAVRPDTAKLRAVGVYAAGVVGTLLIGALVLPTGSVQLVGAGGTYSQAMLAEVGRAPSEVAYFSVDPPPAWDYLMQHPGQYIAKVARMVRRTKLMVDAMSGPAWGGVLFPAFLLSALLLVAGVVAPRKFLLGSEDRSGAEPYLLFAGLIGWTLLFFWPIYLTARFIMHTFPLMVLVCLYIGARMAESRPPMRPTLRRGLVLFAVGYFVAYPMVATVWDSYRQPMKYIGTQLAVRLADYNEMAENIETLLPADAVIISDMAHEITWLTGSRTIKFPLTEADLDYLLDKFEVDAIYEHPRFRREWATIRENFSLVDESNGTLWVRRDDH